MTIERIHSGIYGLDKLLNGGYPKNYVILVAGGPGSGKQLSRYSTFTMEPKTMSRGFIFLLSKIRNI